MLVVKGAGAYGKGAEGHSPVSSRSFGAWMYRYSVFGVRCSRREREGRGGRRVGNAENGVGELIEGSASERVRVRVRVRACSAKETKRKKAHSKKSKSKSKE